MRFTSKQVVTMVVAVSAAVVLAPVGVMAATGQLVNVADAVDPAFRTRVSSNGGLFVETHPRVASTFNAQKPDVADTNVHPLYVVGAPTRVAVTDLQVTVRDNGTSDTLGTVVELLAFASSRDTLTGCGGAGWNRSLLRRVTAQRAQTVQVTFDGSPLVLPTVGGHVCLAFQVTRGMASTVADVAVTGFVFK